MVKYKAVLGHNLRVGYNRSYSMSGLKKKYGEYSPSIANYCYINLKFIAHIRYLLSIKI